MNRISSIGVGLILIGIGTITIGVGLLLLVLHPSNVYYGP